MADIENRFPETVQLYEPEQRPMRRPVFAGASSGDFNIGDVLAIFKRQRILVIITALVILTVALIYAVQQGPMYRSTARILVDIGRSTGTSAIEPIAAPTKVIPVDTQLEILNSGPVISEVYTRALAILDGADRQAAELTRPDLRVDSVRDTEVVRVDIDHPNPNVARAFAQVFPIVYGEEIGKIQRDGIDRALRFLQGYGVSEPPDPTLIYVSPGGVEAAVGAAGAEGSASSIVDFYATSELGKAQARLDAAQTELRVFELGAGPNSIRLPNAEQEIQRRANDLSTAKAQVASAEAQVQAAQAALNEAISARRALPARVTRPSTQDNEDAINLTKREIDELKGTRNQLLQRYLPDSNEVQEINARISQKEEFLRNLEQTVDRLIVTDNPEIPAYDSRVQTARESLASARAVLGEAEAYLRGIESEVDQMQKDVEQWRQLERKRSAADAEFSKLLTQRNDIRLQANQIREIARDVSEDRPPAKMRPNYPKTSILALLVGIVLGLVLAIVRDVAQDRVNSAGEASRITGAQVLGRIPLRPKYRHPLITDPQGAKAFESYRLVRSSLASIAGGEVRSLLVTSTKDGEGKSVVAANLAIAMAFDGKRTILVDANLRTPLAHRLFKLDQVPGLSEVLAGGTQIADALHETAVPNLQVMTAGNAPATPAEWLSSDEMRKLHDKLRGMADVVIYDSVSAVPLADTQSLAAIVGQSLMVVELHKPTRADMKEAVAVLSMADSRILGVVVNKVRVKKGEV